MSSEALPDDVAVRVEGVGKCYHVYRQPKDRLKQFLFGRYRRYYDEFWACRGIDLEIRRGTTCGIVGHNGAGKTTLLQMIAGTLRPTEGRVRVNGRTTALLELGSGFHRELSGRDNVFLYGSVLGVPRREIEARFDAIASFADIGPFIDRPVKTYSKGMYARLAFAVLANLEPEIFIIDEALAVGDARFRHRCMDRFHELKDRGTTILYVSHDALSMKRLCESVLWIENGRTRGYGPSGEVVDAYLESLFLGQVPEEEGGAPGPEAARPAATPEAPAEPLPPAAPAPAAERPQVMPRHEPVLPNADRRHGDGRLRIVGAGLYDASGRATDRLQAGEPALLRVTIRNDGVDPAGSRLRTGWVLRNRAGEEISGTNTQTEGLTVEPPPVGEQLTVAYRIDLAWLQPGPYALTLAASHMGQSGEAQTGDRVVNAVLFEVLTSRPVHGLFAMKTQIEVIR